MKIRLQIGVTTAFTAIAVFMIGITVAILYQSNHRLALETARSEMTSARENTVENLINVIVPVGQVVETTVDFIKTFPEAITEPRSGAVMASQIKPYSYIYGLFFGLEDQGQFYQVVQVPVGVAEFGPNKSPLPANTKIIYRTIDGPINDMIETFLYQSSWGTVTGREKINVEYDPRTRPWYEGARKQDEIFVSSFYIFNSTGKPGVTFAKRVTDTDGKLLGVVGADLTMDKITNILNDIRIGNEGRVFLLDREDGVIAYSGTRDDATDLKFTEAGNRKIDDSIVETAITQWIKSRETFFNFTGTKDGRRYLASAAPIPELFGISPTLGFIVPEDEFVGAIKETTRNVLQIAAIIIVVTVILIVIISRMLSRQLNAVALEAEKVGHFDLEGDFQMSSHIYEVSALANAVSNMKVSLKNFGSYVPVDLVKSIVASGHPVEIGGTSRELSIMFTDIEGFTGKTESYAPTALMLELSNYFAAMEKEITANGNGTIDKYIGDAIMAFWNAPTTDPDHAVHACRAALACRHAGRQLNSISSQSELFPLRTRFGLHCDQVVVGNVGSKSRIQYTALGAAVNLASRIEGLNKIYGTRILASGTIARKAQENFLFRFVDRVSPVGTTLPVDIFELLGEKDEANSDLSATKEQYDEVSKWNACMTLYRNRNWQESLEAFNALKTHASVDKLVSIYIKRCRQFIKSPPPSDWGGVSHIETK
ncbi:adenylate/guanylate cyclase domain-containing protein [Thalassospira lucentensis]|nr:adenylate/guanylate cyclase domain-containing protein [Thalassospira lucentensis]MCH2273346.1 adenylate/guanylate cyclase domain-containing protein [Thalassospira sp.]